MRHILPTKEVINKKLNLYHTIADSLKRFDGCPMRLNLLNKDKKLVMEIIDNLKAQGWTVEHDEKGGIIVVS